MPQITKNIALFFGSFNPIHVGHLIIANHIANQSFIDECWFVVSPQNPFKEKSSLLKDYHRLAMVNEAIDDNPLLKSCDIEFHLPKPSYTVDSLTYLKEKHPQYDFSIVMGEDNLKSFHKWKNYEIILRDYKVIVYPRIFENTSNKPYEIGEHKNIHILKDIPVMNISASFIRNAIKNNESIKYLVTEPVSTYIDRMNFYK